MDNLIEASFNKHYKTIQSFRNQYLNMIRCVLKRKDDLTFEEIMQFNNLENQLYNIRKDITNYSSEIIKNKNKNKNKQTNNNNNQNKNNQTPLNVQILKDDSDLKMIKTLNACLPIMIMYYNNLDNQILVDGIPLD